MLKNNYDVFYFTLTRLDSLAIGAFLSVLEIKNELNTSNANKFLIIAICIIVPTILLWVNYTGKSDIYIQVIKYLLLSLLYFSFIGYVLCIDQNHFINKILKSSFLSYSGKNKLWFRCLSPICIFHV